MRIALFKSQEHGYEMIFAALDHEGKLRDSFSANVRISEPLDVEFTPRKRDEVIAAQIGALDKSIERVTQEFAQKLDDLKKRKAALLAITHQQE